MTLARTILSAFLVGVLSLGVAWAGAGLSPAPRAAAPDGATAAVGVAGVGIGGPGGNPVFPALPGLQGDEILAGAAKHSIHPRPGPDDVWIRDRSQCETLGSGADHIPEHLTDLASLWPENPGCIYTGGYGIGPMNAVESFDETYGLWARSLALSDGQRTVVLTVVDGTYWQGRYGRMCEACGAFDLAEQLTAELGGHYGLDESSFFFAASHAHTAPDFIGGWGGVPVWYMEQVAETLRQSVRDALAALRPAVLEAGEILARDHNRDRRSTYRSAEEAGLSWLRAVGTDGDVVATLGAYAAHPTTVGVSGVAHADWPALFTHRLEQRFDGVGLFFQTGLGQMTARGGTVMGDTLADLVPPVGRGQAVRDPAVRSAAHTWDQPITNGPLAALGGAGLFDRPFGGPAQVSAGRSEQRPCVSAAPISVTTGVNAARVGNLVFTGAPGETFANLSNTIKEARTGQVAFPLSIVNDGLGYIMQSFEHFDEARGGLGFAGTKATEYEDAYAIDRCFGDMVLEHSLRLVDGLFAP